MDTGRADGTLDSVRLDRESTQPYIDALVRIPLYCTARESLSSPENPSSKSEATRQVALRRRSCLIMGCDLLFSSQSPAYTCGDQCSEFRRCRRICPVFSALSVRRTIPKYKNQHSCLATIELSKHGTESTIMSPGNIQDTGSVAQFIIIHGYQLGATRYSSCQTEILLPNVAERCAVHIVASFAFFSWGVACRTAFAFEFIRAANQRHSTK